MSEREDMAEAISEREQRWAGCVRSKCKVDLQRHSKPAPEACEQCGPGGEAKGWCPFWRVSK